MFENTLIASRRQRAPRQRLLALPVAVTLHLLALSGFVLGQLVVTAPVPEPALIVSFHQLPLPPAPAPSDRGGQARSSPAPARAQPHAGLQQPREMPAESARPAEPDSSGPPTGMEELDTTGTGIGVGEGSGGAGVGGGTGLAAPVEEPPIILTADVNAPLLVHRVDPVYPEIAVKARTQGVVILEAIIDREGQVVGARVLRDIGMGCGNAALQAVRQWRYRPATLNGRTVAVYLTVTVRFELH
ncbi:MAG TPA: energy transducer TonB [Thermoanaerobaculaceae bacterium]|nr:energy transducer TonB [Thermoanaerobaculaceae bacterium]HRS16708.1 energy transducer TonB [Thermoanaerobaculaceae bacterium]